MTGDRIKVVQKNETKIKFVVLKVISIINLIKHVMDMGIGVVCGVVNNGGTNIKKLV